MFDNFIHFVQTIYGTNDFIPLHEPRFTGNEKRYLMDAIDSNFVSSVGAHVSEFERKMAEYLGAKHAIATTNGTAALHIALLLAGVRAGDEVITQSLTFVATCNAIRYCGAKPLLVDVDRTTLGLSAESLEEFLCEFCEMRNDGCCWNKISGSVVRACMPMHTFGFPVQLDELRKICECYNLALVEDAAESLGSTYKQQNTGTFGRLSALSFNGNKIITTGGGGMLLTNDEQLAERARHITTTAKVPHHWDFLHDETAYNYRLPNLNAALGIAQLESLPDFLGKKRELAKRYQQWGGEFGLSFVTPLENTQPNYWLNAVVTKNRSERDAMLEYTHKNGVMTRPAWIPMHKLSMNLQCQKGDLKNTEWLFDRLVNVPSSVVVDE